MKLRLALMGVSPLLMHGDRLAMPLDPVTREIAKITKKRKKTEEDLQNIFRLEFLGGIYHDDALGPYVPGRNVVRAIADAAKVSRRQTAVERGLVPLSFKCPVEYDGPRTVEELWAAGYYEVMMVGIQNKRTPRCRPRFTEWNVSAEFECDDRVLDVGEVIQHTDAAGRMVGLGDGRRIGFGRFTAQVFEL